MTDIGNPPGTNYSPGVITGDGHFVPFVSTVDPELPDLFSPRYMVKLYLMVVLKHNI